MNTFPGFSRLSPWMLIVAVFLFQGEFICALAATNQDTEQSQIRAQADAKAKADAQAEVEAAIQKIRTACQVSDTETDPKKVNKQADCVARAVAAQKRKINTQRALRSTLTQAFGLPSI